jgi:hypothetical protein
MSNQATMVTTARMSRTASQRSSSAHLQGVEFGVGIQDGLALGPGGLVERSRSGEQVLHVEGREPDRHCLSPQSKQSHQIVPGPRAEQNPHSAG